MQVAQMTHAYNILEAKKFKVILEYTSNWSPG